MVAVGLRKALTALKAPKDVVVYPASGGTSERSILLGEGSRKRIDVAVVHPLGGLRIDISLKGMNFRGNSGNYDHNLTGRTYELEDELRQVRNKQPSAFVFALYWIPLAGAWDKAKAETSLARTVLLLRARVHKGAPGTPRPPDFLDGAAGALYAPADTPLGGSEVVQRGVFRCLDVTTEPPQRGRPRLDTTVSLDDILAAWVTLYLDSLGLVKPKWAQPEVP
jgi:hypothetical protein